MTRVYEGIVLRQTKTMGGRRMVLIFTREAGKISAGTFISEKSKSGSALAIRPFSYGQFTVSEKGQDFRTVTAAETLDAFFGLGEDVDRFSEASFVLEFSDKLLPDGVSEPGVFDLLKEYLAILSRRKGDFRLLTIAYMIKVMKGLGLFPDAGSLKSEDLLSGLNDDILSIVVFIEGQPLKRMESLRLETEKENAVFEAIRGFAQKHLDLGAIKSESMLAGRKQDLMLH